MKLKLSNNEKKYLQGALSFNEAEKYIKKFNNKIFVIKYGGSALDNRYLANNFAKDLVLIKKLGINIVILHGGGVQISETLKKRKINSKFINGLRVTDKKIVDTVEEVLIDFNNDIVNSLKKLGSEAASFHTKNSNIIEVEPEREELGFVGIPKKINANLIEDELNKNKIPIIAP